MRKIDRMSKLPEVTRCTKYYEHDGLLRAYANRAMLLAMTFGVLAMAATAATFLGLIKDFGVGQAIIQRPDITKGQVDALFWLSVLASAASALILALSAYPISLFYDDPRLQRLTIAIAGLSLIAGLPTVPYALLARESRFKALAILEALERAKKLTAAQANWPNFIRGELAKLP